MDGLTGLVMTVGMVYLIAVLLMSTVALVYCAYVGFYVMVRTEITPKAARMMKTMDMPTGVTIADVLADIEAQEKAAGALGYQKVGKA